MNISIVTQALLDNYGGLLQNFALQRVLKSMGHSPKTIDYRPLTNFYSEFPRVFGSWLKTVYLFVFKGVRRDFARFRQPKKRNSIFDSFVTQWINVSAQISQYSYDLLKREMCDAVIVGSDQVWRPNMNLCIEDMYLKFAKNIPTRRIAYAASFGVDEWEYTEKQTKECSALAKKFKAISVREESGVGLCKNNLDVDATWVLDPTLLLQKDDYLKICEDVPAPSKTYLAAYVLNMDESIRKTCEQTAAEKGLELKVFSADAQASLSVPEWLAMFRDASFVITDSFHGTAFSIIFKKEFKCIYNESRGSARFDSLLNLYNSGKLEEMRQFSLNWLRSALES